MLYGLYLVLLYDLWKVIFNKNIKWSDSEELLYTYSDFVIMDLRNLKAVDIILFVIFIKIFYFIFKIYVLILLLFVVNMKTFNIKVNIKSDNIISKILEKAFVNSKILLRIKIKDLIKIRNLWRVLIQLSFLMLWGYPKISISYGIYVFEFIKNWFKYGNRTFKDLGDKIRNILDNSISEDYKKLKSVPYSNEGKVQ